MAQLVQAVISEDSSAENFGEPTPATPNSGGAVLNNNQPLNRVPNNTQENLEKGFKEVENAVTFKVGLGVGAQARIYGGSAFTASAGFSVAEGRYGTLTDSPNEQGLFGGYEAGLDVKVDGKAISPFFYSDEMKINDSGEIQDDSQLGFKSTREISSEGDPVAREVSADNAGKFGLGATLGVVKLGVEVDGQKLVNGVSDIYKAVVN